MEKGFPVVDEDTAWAEVLTHLHSSPAVLVEEYGRITGIITRHDVLDAPAGSRG
jgi:predicted transcriptional regulator